MTWMKIPQRVKQPDISQSLWWHCCGTVKSGLAGHHSWCEREETDLHLATMGDPDVVGKAMVRAEECCPLWVSLNDFDTGLKSLLLHINLHSQSNFISLLSGGNDKYVFFSCWHGLPQCTSYKTRSLNCRHWLPAGALMELEASVLCPEYLTSNHWRQQLFCYAECSVLKFPAYKQEMTWQRILFDWESLFCFSFFFWRNQVLQAFCIVFFSTCNFEGSWEEILGYLPQGLYIYIYTNTYVLYI